MIWRHGDPWDAPRRFRNDYLVLVAGGQESSEVKMSHKQQQEGK
jgi:hypothetical protein